ncbi:MAG TPA: amylo-alpha-1,6-glucosidase [Clostridiaceae bacterium]|nr:amylo-alpha-1,6-glucosidase [Clostridiaceae bacterium]
MDFRYGKNDWKTLRRGQENCYLLTNRKGGYSSMSMVGSCARNEHVLLMASVKAPNTWVQLVAKMEEVIAFKDKVVSLAAQEHVGYLSNQEGQRYLDGFSVDPFPRWSYLVEGLEMEKSVIMAYEENLVMVRYRMENHTTDNVVVRLRPWLRFTPKGTMPVKGQVFEVTGEAVKSNGYQLFHRTDGRLEMEEEVWKEDLYFEDDARDGREAIGTIFSNHSFVYELMPGEEREAHVIYSLDRGTQEPDEIVEEELSRLRRLQEQSGLRSRMGRHLVTAADRFVVDRESTGGRTIIAGYPFFGDWGRDTMIAVMGCCIAAGRKDDTESIFRTFMTYVRRGIMPNMFPEGDLPPMYNTVDASLLFIYAVYTYYLEFEDLDFVREAMPVMMEIVEWYKKGTDFRIRMEEDGLISAGEGYDQVTWMDVRIKDVLPTPRHGKPVEINAYWYNDLKVMEWFSKLTGLGDASAYGTLSEKVKVSFNEKFWNEEKGCLRDVVSGTSSDNQIRCNQIWAVSVPFGMLDKARERQVVETVYTHLYTPYGLRSLSPEDAEFRPSYGGLLWDRDLSYHQGTVWGFPLGGYYLAYLKVNGYSRTSMERVKRQLDMLEGTLREGCIGQIAEIFDEEDPSTSRGCFAQAWSVGELLRVFKALEHIPGVPGW